MIKFLTITLRNFLAFGNVPVTFNLERPGTTLILGENLDDTSTGTGSNGVGKSTIFNALSYALYDTPISKVRKIDALVNNVNKKNMEVILEFIGEDGNHYKIHRMRKMKSGAEGNRTLFYENGVDKSRNSADTNKDILKAIGIPYELFVSIVVFSATSSGGFLNKEASDQKAFMEDLTGLTLMTTRADKLKEKVKSTKKDLELQQQKVDQLLGEHERHKTLIINAKKRVDAWKVQTQQTIESLFTKLEQIENVDIEGEAVYHAQVADIGSEMRDLQSKIKERRRSDNQDQTSRRKIEDELTHLRDSKCPYCLQQFANTADKIAALEQESAMLNTRIGAALFELEGLDTEYQALKQRHDDAQSKITVKDLDQLIEIKNESRNIKRKIAELDTAVNPFIEPLTELESAQLEPINYEALNSTKKILDHQQFLLKLLTKSDSFIRKDLISTTLPFLNKQLRMHLHTLGLPHTVEFTAELEPKITKAGSEFEYTLLSNGQKARLNFGLSVAFKDVRERLNGKTNIIVFDEVLDFGLDAIGVAACSRLLKQIVQREGTSMYIISHRDEISNAFDNRLTVRMEKGFSTIVES